VSIRAGAPRRRGASSSTLPGGPPPGPAPQASPDGGAGPGGPGREPARRQAWLLTVCCVAQFMVILDLTIVNVALPSIQASLGFSAINLQWVIDAYAIVFAGFLMLGGRAADQFGARRSLVAALTLFALASLVGGLATSQLMLIAARAVQGLSGALMAAASLAAITSSFPAGPARHRAIGLWGAMNGAGGAAGALLGGVITAEIGWRWVLLINPPVGIAAAVVAYLVIAGRPAARPSAARFDLAGALSLTGGLMLAVYGIVNASALGWTAPLALGPIVAGAVLLGLFPLVESRLASAPLVPPGTLTRPLRRANLVVLLFSAALFPMWFVSSLYLQQVLGLSPLDAGLTFFPMALVIMVAARLAGRLVGRFGVRPVLGAGLVMLACGLLLLARIGPTGSALGFVLLPGILVAAGIGLSVVPSTIAATQAAGPAQAGLASGLVNTSRQVGGSLGIALLISIATVWTSHLIGGGAAVPNALTDGFRVAYLIGAGLALAAAGVVALRPRSQPAVPGAATGPAQSGPAQGGPAPARLSARARLALPAGVAVLIAAVAITDVTAAGAPGAPIGAYSTTGAYSFVSAPGLHPPVVSKTGTTDTAALQPGYFLLSSFYDLTSHPMTGQSGPLLVDNSLQPVWFRPVPQNAVASSLSAQTYQGAPVLTWWQGTITSTGATESGEYVVVNQHYQTVATLHGADGWVLTLHSLVIQGHDAWVTANKDEPMNLTSYGGARNGAITDSAVQEYDLRTGRLVSSWDALDHIPLTDTHATPPTNGFPWDAYHVNSITVAGPGKLLVSMRNTWAAYLIDTATGKIEWQLGGRHSSFRMAAGASFEWQHDVSLHGSQVTLFDDDCCQITGAGTYLAPDGPSRALVLTLNQATHTATLAAQYRHGTDAAAYMGSAQLLPNGNMLVGWGELPYFSEYSAGGKLLLEGEFPAPDISYRANQVSHWTGLPLTKPSGAARQYKGAETVYASWNGATRVASWQVLAGTSAAHLTVVATHPRTGFETAIGTGTGYRVYEVQALDARGHVIGTSARFTSAKLAHPPVSTGQHVAPQASNTPGY
jgi:EmrB/QacA subfamily drug resistance transporter